MNYKFRGKRVKTGEWIDGCLIQYLEKENPDIVWAKASNIKSFCEVFPESVGQWTGLTVKDGTDAYEGDIIKWQQFGIYPDDFYIAKIVFNKGRFCLVGKNNRGKFVETNNIDYYLKRSEIIGNIYDNPELLEGK